MVYYDSASIYVNGCLNIREKIQRLDNIITALEMQAVSTVDVSHIQEYDLDSGQSKVKMVYRSASELAEAINAFETIKQKWINRLNGRKSQLTDRSNFMRKW